MVISPLRWQDTNAKRRCQEHLDTCWGLLEARIAFMRGRPKRVRAIAVAIGERMRLDARQMYSLRLAASFHDLGMLGISDAILLKPGPLAPEEKTIVHRHVEMSGQLIGKAFFDFPEALEAIWYHHECPDGSGYFGMKENSIPLLSSIVAIAAAVDAMANHRPYRPALSLTAIRQEITAQRGKQFCPIAVEAILPLLDRLYPLIVEAKSAPPPGEIVALHTN